MSVSNRIELFQFCLSILLVIFTITACASAPDIHLPDPMPSAISEYKNLRIWGTRRKVNTGIYLNQGDIYSIIATGNVSRNRQHKIGPKSPNFQKYIGDVLIGAAFSWGTNGSMYEAPTSGWLYLGIVDSYPDDNTGAFRVVVIRWKEGDYAQIADFFARLKERNPSNADIRDASVEAERIKQINQQRFAKLPTENRQRKSIYAFSTGEVLFNLTSPLMGDPESMEQLTIGAVCPLIGRSKMHAIVTAQLRVC